MRKETVEGITDLRISPLTNQNQVFCSTVLFIVLKFIYVLKTFYLSFYSDFV